MKDRKPKLYSALVLCFPRSISKESLLQDLDRYCGIRIFEEETEDYMEVAYKEVSKLYSWEIDDALTPLFDGCDLEYLKDLLKKYNGKALIDIAFYHRETYPALVFNGKNMAKIHALNADISIDPY